MFPKPIVLVSDKSKTTDKNLKQIMNFMGITPNVVPLGQLDNGRCLSQKQRGNNKPCLLASGETIFRLLKLYDENADSIPSLINQFHSILIYGLDDSQYSLQVAKVFSDDTVSSITKFASKNCEFNVAKNFKNICGPFSDLTFGPINKKIDFGFDLKTHSEKITQLIQIEDRGFFLKIKKGEGDIFLLACKEFLNIYDEFNIDSDIKTLNIKPFFSRIIPVLMYLKYAFHESCWHINKRYASLIIDDPLLKPNYGYLNYEEQLRLMDKYNFSTNIAFIPWNYRRTSPFVSKMFLDRPDKYSISVHGYGHDNNDFGSENLMELNRKVKLAKTRMKHHRQKTEIKFDNVMVFPQGRFSNISMRILKLNGFLAAVNSEIIPYGDDSSKMKISELLSLAITKYSSFPLFTRRYPSDGIVNFAFDLFMGKPCFIVMHHDFLKEGYSNLINCIQQINSLDSELQWKDLGNILSRAHLRRLNFCGEIEVKMYSNNLILKNDTDEIESYKVYKEDVDFAEIRKITINGNETTNNVDKQNLICIEFNIEPRQEADLKIHYNDPYKHMEINEKISERTKTYVRRHLSEFRDNYLCKNDRAWGMVSKIRNTLNRFIH